MNIEDLGRRAVACAHWRWMPGMLAYVRITLDDKPYERRVQVVSGNGRSFLGTTTRPGKSADDTRAWGMVRHVQAAPVEEEDFIPDLTDPATLGCLLYLVREAWPDEWTDYAVPVHDGFDGWTFGVITRNAGPGQVNVITVFASSVFPWHPSEAAALVAALEAAP